MAVNILDKKRLQLVWHFLIEVKTDRGRSFTLLVVDLQSEGEALRRSKLGRIAPQFLVSKLLAIPQTNNESGPYALPFAAKSVGNEDIGISWDIFLATELRWKDQLPSLRCVLRDAKRMIEKGLHECAE